MSEYILTLTGADTHAAFFENPPAGWGVEIRNAWHAGDALRILEKDPADCRILILDRTQIDPLQPLVERFRRVQRGLEILVLGAGVGENVRADMQAQGIDLLDRSRPAEEILQEIQRRFQRAKFQFLTGIRGRSPKIHEILETVLQVGPTDIPIFISGPSGVGKELVARACFLASRRSHKPFLTVNTGALAESIIESELFGHEKGAFTGADSRKRGLFESADGGTLFLDEVGEMSEHMQVRLLRVLEGGEITPVGSTRALRVDVRILAATNRQLEIAVQQGQFREDLYYRLKAIHLEVPGLAKRPEDIHELAEYFLLEACRQYKAPLRAFSTQAVQLMLGYEWPGNIRQLRNVVASIAVLAKGKEIEPADFPKELLRPRPDELFPVPTHRSRSDAERDIVLQSLLAIRQEVREVLQILKQQQNPSSESHAVVVEPEPISQSLPLNLRETERDRIQQALTAVDGNRRKAATALGIAQRTLYRKIKEYGLE